MDNSVKRAWNNKAVGIALLAATAIAAIALIFTDSSPGIAVSVLGLVAAILAIRELSDFEKMAWVVVLSALLYSELHAIGRADLAHKEEITRIKESIEAVIAQAQQNFAVTKKNLDAAQAGIDQARATIDEAKKGLDSTLIDVQATQKQTEPHADVRWISESIFTQTENQEASDDLGGKFLPNHKYAVRVRFQNFGQVDAQDLKLISKIYVIPNAPAGSLPAAVREFESAWKTGYSRLMSLTDTTNGTDISEGVSITRLVPGVGESRIQQRPSTQSFSEDEANSLNAGDSKLYFIRRLEYTDPTGRWREDRCEILLTPPGSETVRSNPCSMFVKTRYPMPW